MKPKMNYELDKSRVISYLDVDCFSVQIAFRFFPDLKGKPCATRRTPTALIDSVSYEANEYKVYRGMTEKEARDQCPSIQFVTKSEIHGFKDEYEKASNQLFEVIRKFCSKDIIIEKRSFDDLYLDLTDKCNAFLDENFTYDRKFLQSLNVVVEGGVRQMKFGQIKALHNTKWTEAAVLMTDLCDQIYSKTDLMCSVGISFNKLLAKIGRNLNKPDNITIIASKSGITRIFESWPIYMCDGLGSRLGQAVEDELKISNLKELRAFRKRPLIEMFGPGNGTFLWQVCRGIDTKPVEYRIDFNTIGGQKKTYSKGINCETPQIGKDLTFVCKQFADKLIKDMQQNQRIAHRIRIEVFTKNGRTLSTTAFLMFKDSYDANKIYDTVMAKGFPYISQDVPKYIKGFRLVAIDFKRTQHYDPMTGLSQRLSQITL